MLRFFAGWALVISSAVFMVSGTLPAAAATLKLLAPGFVDSQAAVTLVAALWLVSIGAVVAKGIKLSSYMQVGFTLVEVGVLVLFYAVATMGFAGPPAHAFAAAWLIGAGFTPALFASGAATALFALSGWDVTANLSEETRDGARIAGAGSIFAVAIVALLLIGFNVLALWLLSDAEISRAGINIVSVVAQKLLPHPWDYLAVVAVMLSTIGTLETSILQFTRTLFSMSRDHALHPRYGRLHPVYRTPWVATLLITGLGLVLLFGSSYLPGIKTVIDDFDQRRGLSGRLLLRADRACLRLVFPGGGANRHRQICFSVCLALARRRLLFRYRHLQCADLRYYHQHPRRRQHRNRPSVRAAGCPAPPRKLTAPDQLNPKNGARGYPLSPVVAHIAIGDVEGMVGAISNLTVVQHSNVYMSLAVFRSDLRKGRKGFEKDIVAVLGLRRDLPGRRQYGWAAAARARRRAGHWHRPLLRGSPGQG